VALLQATAADCRFVGLLCSWAAASLVGLYLRLQMLCKCPTLAAGAPDTAAVRSRVHDGLQQ
jgi:hypothetical protein